MIFQHITQQQSSCSSWRAGVCVEEMSPLTMKGQVRTSHPAHHSSHPPQTFSNSSIHCKSWRQTHSVKVYLQTLNRRQLQKYGLLCVLIAKKLASSDLKTVFSQEQLSLKDLPEVRMSQAFEKPNFKRKTR